MFNTWAKLLNLKFIKNPSNKKKARNNFLVETNQQLLLTRGRWPALKRSTHGHHLVYLCLHSSPPSAEPPLTGRLLLPSWEALLPPDWTNSPEQDPPPGFLWPAVNFLRRKHIHRCVKAPSCGKVIRFPKTFLPGLSVRFSLPNFRALNTSGFLLSSSVKKRARMRRGKRSGKKLPCLARLHIAQQKSGSVGGGGGGGVLSTQLLHTTEFNTHINHTNHNLCARLQRKKEKRQKSREAKDAFTSKN